MKNSLSIYSIWRGDRNPELRGYTGRIFEREVLGECTLRACGRMSFRQAVKMVRWNQPGDPYRPKGEVGNFHRAVADRMRDEGLQGGALGLFTAVGTILDRAYGIDGFFSFQGIMVSVDCTLDQNQDPYPSARVIVTGEDMINGYKRVAEEVVGLFKHAKATGRKGVI